MPATIGFDVDGVLGDYPGFIKSAAKELGITITATRYPDTWFMIEDGWFSNRDEWAVCHEWVLSNCRDMPWLDVHAAEQSRILKDHGFEVVVVTSRTPKGNATEDMVFGGTAEFLEKGGFLFDDLIFSDDDKSIYGLDILLDDSPLVHKALSNASTHPVIRSQPYNLDVQGTRVADTVQYRKLVEEAYL